MSKAYISFFSLALRLFAIAVWLYCSAFHPDVAPGFYQRLLSHCCSVATPYSEMVSLMMVRRCCIPTARGSINGIQGLTKSSMTAFCLPDT